MKDQLITTNLEIGRACKTASYSCFIITLALSCTVCESLSVIDSGYKFAIATHSCACGSTVQCGKIISLGVIPVEFPRRL